MILAAVMFAACLPAGAQTSYQVLRACHPEDVRHYDNETLRERFMMPKVMEADKILLTYTQYDRLIFGGVMPVSKTLELETIDPLTQ